MSRSSPPVATFVTVSNTSRGSPSVTLTTSGPRRPLPLVGVISITRSSSGNNNNYILVTVTR